MTQFYAYVHLRPDLTPFYVGKGNGSRAWKLRSRNRWHRNVVEKYGAENIVVEVMLCNSEREAFFREKQTISALTASGVILTNLTLGGEGFCGGKHSDELKARFAREYKGRKTHTPEGLARLSAYRKTHPISKESAAKISKSNTGKTHSEETKKRLSEIFTGRVVSPEWRAKIKAAALKRPPISEQGRLSRSKNTLGRVWVSNDTCEKLVHKDEVTLAEGWKLGRKKR